MIKNWFVILALIGFFVIGLPLRARDISLDGYVSDDGWWHYRHIKEITDYGHRLDPDIYEFTTLNRQLTYPPFFHYAVAWIYKAVGFSMPLIRFTHYFNFLEYLFYILLIYALGLVLTKDKLWSLPGALGAAVGYAFIIRARAGELMAFALSDIFALGGLVIVLWLAGERVSRQTGKLIGFAFAGFLFGLSILSWQGALLVYLPLPVFLLVGFWLEGKPTGRLAGKQVSGLNRLTGCVICLGIALSMALWWYLPIIFKYGVNPIQPEMKWFMKLTALYARKPLNFYFFACGIPLLFVPVVLVTRLAGWRVSRSGISIFLLFWIIQGIVSAFVGWRGYLAVVPVLSCVMISVGSKDLKGFLFKNGKKALIYLFLPLCFITAVTGLYLSSKRLGKLDPKSSLEARSTERNLKMLAFLREKYPDSVCVDHMFWVSEDEAVGKCRMVNGQYLEYLPEGASEILRDTAKLYFLNEEDAYRICGTYGIELIIVRKQFLEIPKLSLLLEQAEETSDKYMDLTKKTKNSRRISVAFTEKGRQAIFYRMLSRDKLRNFRLVYAGKSGDIVVYEMTDEG